ncbi:conserved hypothetical protein [Ricinus communis]|uniref:Uncharacterized protein n=1 Tax=Ricinus communis TaxID=3988 RepID=B9R9P6_RICCO|nr:conserved hypothetical protein [Ricinus communis]
MMSSWNGEGIIWKGQFTNQHRREDVPTPLHDQDRNGIGIELRQAIVAIVVTLEIMKYGDDNPPPPLLNSRLLSWYIF